MKKQEKNGQYLKKLEEKRDKRHRENLFDEIDEGYYKPVKTKDAFTNSYIEYERRENKDKKLLVKEYFGMIIPY